MLPKILIEVPISRDWFLDLYVFVQSERRPETVNRQDVSELTTLNLLIIQPGRLRFMECIKADLLCSFLQDVK